METAIPTTTVEFEAPAPRKRPTFLTVICILSFIGCALSVIGGIYNIIQATPEHRAQSIEQIRTIDPVLADRMEENMIALQDSPYASVAPYLSFVYALITFMGVLMMWKLNKKGFYVYLAGELLPYLFMLIFWKETAMMMNGGGGGGFVQTVMIASVVMMVVFDIAFFIMYAMNLKHMKNQ